MGPSAVEIAKAYRTEGGQKSFACFPDNQSMKFASCGAEAGSLWIDASATGGVRVASLQRVKKGVFMKSRSLAVAGMCVLVICVAAGAAPKKRAKPAGACANPVEMTAQQTSAIQQELMVSGLNCGDTALLNYNTFQTRFGPELRESDKAMLRMFGRVMGRSKGDKAYNLFKTELAAKAEFRRTQDHDGFCQNASIMAAAALGPSKIKLAEFVGDAPPITMAGGVAGCAVAVGEGVTIVPTPNPLRLASAPAAVAPAVPQP